MFLASHICIHWSHICTLVHSAFVASDTLSCHTQPGTSVSTYDINFQSYPMCLAFLKGFSWAASSERVIELMKKISIPGGCPVSVTCGCERTNMSDLPSWTWTGCGMVTKWKASVELSHSYLLWHSTSCSTIAGLPPLLPPLSFSSFHLTNFPLTK